jgi:hypothetical protein
VDVKSLFWENYSNLRKSPMNERFLLLVITTTAIVNIASTAIIMENPVEPKVGTSSDPYAWAL